VSDNGNELFDIYFALTENCPFNVPNNSSEKYSFGYGIQEGNLCGSVVGDALLIKLLKTLPDTTFDMGAFIFAPSVSFPQIATVNKTGRLLYGDNEVENIEFWADGETILDTPNGYTINTSYQQDTAKKQPVKTILVNDKYVLGGEGYDSVYVMAGKDSGIRVLTENGQITIGRLSEL
jgi:hypothetical protein